MNNWIVIGGLAGITAALMQAAVTTGYLPAMMLVYFAPLPLFMAGLGWGAVTAALGAVVMMVAITVITGSPLAGVVTTVSTGIAPIVLSHLALQNRPAATVPSAEGEVAESGSGIEWYPEGRLVIWTALLSAALSIGVVLAMGPSIEQFRETAGNLLKPFFDEFAKQPNAPPAEQMEQFKTFSLRLLPAAMCMVWGLATMLNMFLAGLILRTSGKGIRPWAAFGRMAFPRWAIWLLSFAALATLVPGTLGSIAWIVTAALLLAYTVLGVATMHGLVEGNPMKTSMLAIFYCIIIFLNLSAFIPLVMLGMLEQAFNFRKRRLNRTTE